MGRCCGRSSGSSSRPKRRGPSTCGYWTCSTEDAGARATAGREPEDLRGAGLSGRKVEYIRDLAAHVICGELELDRLDQLSDEEAIEEIVAVRGLGQWTAEMFLLFHLERPDVLSGGDLGIRKAIQIEYGLEEMPTPTGVIEIGEPWRPHRSLASLYLWESLAAVPGRLTVVRPRFSLGLVAAALVAAGSVWRR